MSGAHSNPWSFLLFSTSDCLAACSNLNSSVEVDRLQNSRQREGRVTGLRLRPSRDSVAGAGRLAIPRQRRYLDCMADSCCAPPPLDLGSKKQDRAYRRVLVIVLVINAVMFGVEVIAGVAAGSASLQADALDFLGDAANYAISLLVVGMALRYRASAALAKGATMGLFGLWVIGAVFWHAVHGTLPSAFTMGTVGVAALLANAASFGLLWAYRQGDANMRSAWICTRNDVLGNLAVLLAALGVFGTGTGWPDVIVATIMAGLALQGAVLVIRQAVGELRPQWLVSAEQK